MEVCHGRSKRCENQGQHLAGDTEGGKSLAELGRDHYLLE